MDIIKSVIDDKEGYYLRLANGQGWQITAAAGVEFWLKQLAHIMELQECEPDGYPRIIFAPKQTEKESNGGPVGHLHPKLKEGLPANGWEPHDFVWLQIWSHREVPDFICEMGSQEGDEQEILKMRMALQPIYQRIQDSGGLPLHAALLERNGLGVLLAGSGSTGKSTCCSRVNGPWRALCDDEALVVRDNSKGYLVHPFPTWSDYFNNRSKQTWNVQHYLPMSAIFFLEQAEADQVTPLGQGLAAALLYESAAQVCARNWVNLNREGLSIVRKRLFENVCDLATEIPVFKLQMSLEGSFWEEMEKVL